MCMIHCAMDRYTIISTLMAGRNKTNFADSSFPNFYKLQSVCDCALWHHQDIHKYSETVYILSSHLLYSSVYIDMDMQWCSGFAAARLRHKKFDTVLKLIHRQITLVHVLSWGVHNSDTLHRLKYIQTMCSLLEVCRKLTSTSDESLWGSSVCLGPKSISPDTHTSNIVQNIAMFAAFLLHDRPHDGERSAHSHQ